MVYRFKVEDLWRKFREFNEEYFNGELNGSKVTLVRSMTRRRLGSCRVYNGRSVYCRYEIKVSGYLDRDEWEIETTLLHEMIHMWQHMVYGKMDHKITFKAKAAEINERGGYDISRLSCVSDNRLSKEALRRTQDSIEYVAVYGWQGKTRVSWISKNWVDKIKWRYDGIVDDIKIYSVGMEYINRYTDRRRYTKRLSSTILKDEGRKQLGERIAV